MVVRVREAGPQRKPGVRGGRAGGGVNFLMAWYEDLTELEYFGAESGD